MCIRDRNMTNGVTFRRWLYKANPELSNLICEAIGDGWIKDYRELEKLTPFADDKAFRDKFAEIKLNNKKKLAKYIKEHNGIVVDPNSLFDVQIKRLHEYKRQLLKAFHIVYRYKSITESPENSNLMPETFIFGAKAAPGYHMAKLIIKFKMCIRDSCTSLTSVNIGSGVTQIGYPLFKGCTCLLYTSLRHLQCGRGIDKRKILRI